MKYLILFCSLALLVACSTQEKQPQETTPEETSTSTESDWVLLFDGSSLDQWRNYNSESLSDKWQIEDGTFTLTERGGGDIMTKAQYSNFELELEWKMSEGGNSGIMYHVVEADSLGAPYLSGPEYQLLDNAGHAEGQVETHRAGDNFDMHASSEIVVRPAMEWNSTRLVVNDGQVEHWLNGTKVVEYTLWDDDFKARLAKSKFADWPAFARFDTGHIALQDHGDQVWFRNVRVREL